MTIAIVLLTNALLAQVGEVDYVKEIRPVLSEKCFACHGALQQKADLRLDTVKAMRDGGSNGPAILPGRAAESLIVRHILELRGARRMPPPSDGEPVKAEHVALIRQWIDSGAKAPADDSPEPDPRDHWAFRSPKKQTPPNAGHPIDAWISAKRRSIGVESPQPAADRRLLLRRVYLDLVGLPPTLDEQDSFLRDKSPDAYEKIVDALLERPQHGERWARHWMDIWRYSDPWGLGAEIRNSQKHIWHWRDWIVESLNRDAPYDQMVRDMLSVDEQHPNDLARLRASGFLARQYFKFNRNTWLDETVEHTTKAFLGLTLNCAKCHDHKYDPIVQEDYYRMRAFFEPYQIRTDVVPGEIDPEKDGIPRAFDCNLDAPTFVFARGDDRQPRTTKGIQSDVPKFLAWAPLEIRAIELPEEAYRPHLRDHVLKNHVEAAERRIDASLKALAMAEASTDVGRIQVARARVLTEKKGLDAILARHQADRAKHRPAGGQAEAAHAASLEQEWNVLQAREAVASAELELSRADAGKKPGAEKALASARAALSKAEMAAKKPGVAYTPLRGAIKTLESNVETAESRQRPFPATSTGRRSALAAWITDRRNPLTARVAVNHIWSRHFGVPLVNTVFDFGRKGATPTHPELLDWLAVDFMENGWSMKRLHRMIVTSETYRMSSSAVGADSRALERDPENATYWRRHSPRMESQIIRDSLLHLSGIMDLTLGGPPVPITQELSPRRSLYFLHSNNDNQRFLAQFDDAAVRECYRRPESIVPQQALALANSKLTLTASAKIADNLQKRFAESPDIEFIRGAFHLLLACDPTADEITDCTQAMEDWRQLFPGRPDASSRARRNLVHALVNHNDFVTIR